MLCRGGVRSPLRNLGNNSRASLRLGFTFLGTLECAFVSIPSASAGRGVQRVACRAVQWFVCVAQPPPFSPSYTHKLCHLLGPVALTHFARKTFNSCWLARSCAQSIQSKPTRYQTTRGTEGPLALSQDSEEGLANDNNNNSNNKIIAQLKGGREVVAGGRFVRSFACSLARCCCCLHAGETRSRSVCRSFYHFAQRRNERTFSRSLRSIVLCSPSQCPLCARYRLVFI